MGSGAESGDNYCIESSGKGSSELQYSTYTKKRSPKKHHHHHHRGAEILN